MSVSNIVGAVLLVGLLHHRLEGLDGARILASYLRFFVAALMAAGVGYLLSRQLHALAGSGSGSVYLALVVAGTGMLAVYGLVLKLLRATEVNDVLAPVMRRLGGR